MLEEKTHILQCASGILPLSGIGLKQGQDIDSAGCQDPYHSLREALQLKLQQRRTREELVSRGIMPPLKSPAAFHEQRRSLERARTEDYLKRKIRSRPERSELVRMHILEETSAEPSLQAKQLKLKRARLADDLNEKIAQRPGPMELVEKNILPVESSLKEAIIVGQVNYPKVADNSSFDEDSSDALSPEQPASHESQGSAPSPLEGRGSEPLATSISVSPPQVVSQLQVCPDSSEPAFLAEQLSPLPVPPLLPPSLPNGGTAPTAKPTPTLIKQSQPKAPGEKPPRSKKAKDLKPKVKKLKYHQYIPPDQKQDKGAPPMDSSYAKILQQQQLFLQLQILNQQQQHYNYQTILPAPPKPVGEPQGSSSPASLRAVPAALGSSASGPPGPAGLVRQNSVTGKLGPLPSNLDDMKVAELKQELKMRALPVSGTKTDLIERLRAYQEHAGVPGPASGAPKPGAAPILAKAGEVVVAFPAARLSAGPALMAAGLAPTEVVVATVTSNGMVKFGSTGSTPPVSPTPSERSLLSTGDENSTGGGGDAFGEMVTSPLTQLTLQASPVQILVKEESPVARAERCGRDLESRDKDQMLQEKDKQIEELTRMLKQKQQLVEMLRLQLEQEKRAQQAAPRPPPPTLLAQVKQEDGFSSCQLTGPSVEPGATPVLAVTVKQEAVPEDEPPSCLLAPELSGLLPGPPPALITDATGTHLVLTVTKRDTQDSAEDEPGETGSGQSPSQGPPSPGPSPLLPFSVPPGLQSFFPNGFHKTALKASVATPSSLPKKPSSEPSSPVTLQTSQMELDHQPQALFEAAPGANPLPTLVKKEPPGYDEAVKQQPRPQEENGSSSQQMDDLFDILIQSGEISADFKEPSPSPGKDSSPALPCPSPATPQPPPELPLPLGTSPAPGRLEDFLESSTGLPLLTGGQEGPEPLSLIDDLHSQMLSSSAILDHPPSPMDTSELHFAHEPSTSLGLDLAEGHLDSMDWLELSGGPVLSLAPPSNMTPSLFSTDFLDGHDLHLHWDSCL
ncbi:myocardin-related transcription factor A isoform X2 [Vombatus ursinus]|uniref:myocardin-related transcription factor A isoform X2 n=1 Tax=Vombatus ursinus TaxID=29139 RepID=UPI000FFD716B|nr:myocardin-related transcription factor A isoform X2 [Vombatus ursinus]